MIDKITTIPRRKFGQRIGTLSPGDMASLERSLLLFFGLTEPSV
jgi:mRNA-degrading endonuclease toxin of MazEF toxin-antitoxin module